MRKVLTVLVVLLATTAFLNAQVRTGNIYGKITDPEGAPLPGITVTLTGSLTAPTQQVTNEQGIFRFISLNPGKDYQISAELEGFKKTIKRPIDVYVGGNTEVNITLELGVITEEVVVLASAPVVDAKKVSTSQNVTKEEMQSLPSARDPWVVLQMAPSIQMDRENVGGNESGSQSGYVGKGGPNTSNGIWSIDGIDVTDPNAIGASPIYFDFDMFEELNISTTGNDITVQTGGIALNMVTRRGGNKHNLAGRFYVTDSKFQSKYVDSLGVGKFDAMKELLANGLYTNTVNNIKDYGFNMGGPIIKDKLWYWGAYGVQDIKTFTVYKAQDSTLLTNYNLKLNAQPIANNRFEALITIGGKEKFGRSSTAANPQGLYQRAAYHFGSPIVKIQDEHTFGSNLFVSAKYAFSNAGFGLWPMMDRDLKYIPSYNYTNRSNTDSLNVYLVKRPKNVISLSANYYNDKLFGLSQEVKIGGEFQNKHEEYVGSTEQLSFNYNYTTPIADLNLNSVLDAGDVSANIKRLYFWRQYTNLVAVKQYVGYVSDTISKGNFTALLGLRYDLQKPYIKPYTVASVPSDQAWTDGAGSANFKGVDAAVQTAFLNVLPAVSIAPPTTPDYKWNTWSPRVGLTYDFGGKGKTIIKLNGAMYGDVMGCWWASYFAPVGGGGSMNFYWNDTNADKKVTTNELFWRNHLADQAYATHLGLYQVFDGSGNFIGASGSGTANDWTIGYQDGGWGGFDPANPSSVDYTSRWYYFANNAQSSRTSELVAQVEHEIFKDFGASIDLTYRRFDHYQNWEYYYPTDPANAGNPTPAELMDWSAGYYTQRGVVPATIGDLTHTYSTGGAAGKPWYTLDDSVLYTDYRYIARDTGFYQYYLGGDLTLTKRLSHKWMGTFSFTYQDQKQVWGKFQGDLTNAWVLNKGMYAPYIGGASGKISQYIFSKWMGKLSGMYQLPYGFNISGTFNIRQGNPIPQYFTIYDSSLTGGYTSNTIYMAAIDALRLPTMYDLNLRLEKMIKFGENGRVYLMVDAFNVLNKGIINRRYDANIGSYDVFSGTFDREPTNFALNELLNPRIFRFGVRFEF